MFKELADALPDPMQPQNSSVKNLASSLSREKVVMPETSL